LLLLENYSVANTVYTTVVIRTSRSIIYCIAVTDIEYVLRAIAPDRMLNEPRKHLRETPVEGAGINVLGRAANDVGTSAWSIAGRAVGVACIEVFQNAGAMQAQAMFNTLSDTP
jgi:hypothetical protein